MPPLTSQDIVDGSVKRGGSETAIQHHYDVSNEFYALWLDPSLTYSCALWNDDNDLEGLDEAQRRKLDFHLAASGAPQARHILDIGCGWGSLLDRALGHQGIETATGLTLSDAQLQYIRARGDARIDARKESWIDHTPTQKYELDRFDRSLGALCQPG